jgi:hypothetical protein
MSDRLQAEALLREYGDVTGLGALAFDDEGHCRLEFNERVLVDIAFDEPRGAIVLMTPLGEVRLGERPELAADMLDANALWRGTDGATLGIDRASGLAVLSQAVPLTGLELGDFEGRIDAFIATAEFWLDRVASKDDVSAASLVGSSPDPMQMRV